MARVINGHLLLAVALFLAGCVAPPPAKNRSNVTLTPLATSEEQWTGIAVSRGRRLFVNFPRWSEAISMSVAEIGPKGQRTPYPNRAWNRWGETLPARNHFVCVQSVFVDDRDRLWILDAANPRFEGVVPGGPKLVMVDLQKGAVMRNIGFEVDVAPRNSYLNDVRIDTARHTAYISDSGAGAIIVVDLRTGKSRRLLDEHPSTASQGTPIVFDGKAWTRADGGQPDVHVDGIALSPDGDELYYHALTAGTLYRIDTDILRDPDADARALDRHVESVTRTGPVDGICFGPDERLYLTDLEGDAITRWSPDRGLEVFVQDPRLVWPDSLAAGPGNQLYVTTSQIHKGSAPPEPYRLFRFDP